MYLTIDKMEEIGSLGQFDPNNEGYEFMEEFYPKGAEIMEIMRDSKVPVSFLHWIYQYLNINEEEQKLYKKILNIDEDSEGFYKSEDLSNSQYISYSKKVKDSYIVGNSEQIENSNHVSHSKVVKNSSFIQFSHFCYHSSMVLRSTNVNSSSMITHCGYVVNSHNAIESNFITNCSYVKSSSQINSCHVIDNCVNLRNSLFCYGLRDKEYYLFNRPIEKEHYELILEQFEDIVRNIQLPIIIYDDENNTIQRKYNLHKIYDVMPENFWEWVATLPNYDPKVLYDITFHDSLL